VVETGGLENRCTGNRTGGSNPSPSAKQSRLQRIAATACCEIPRNWQRSSNLIAQTGHKRTSLYHSSLGLGAVFSGGQARGPVSRPCMKLWHTVGALIACAGAVVLVLAFLHHRQAALWSITRTRAERGDASAQFDLASAYYYGKGVPQDHSEALRWYQKAADQGEPRAEDALGYMYLTGVGVPQDPAIALRWYKKAADHGSAKGQFDLATVYDEGIGVPPNYVEASRWFRKSADQNYAKAQDALGYMYYAGRGLPQDHVQALLWYQKAAEQGYAKAEFDLASMYYKGLGTSQNYAEARRWCIKAAKQGNPDAQQALVTLGAESSTVTILDYSEFLGGLFLGVWSLMDLLLHRRKPLDWRQAPLLLFGLVWLGISGMSLYVILHRGLLYCSYPVAFHIVKRLLIAGAMLICVIVILPAKKRQSALPRQT
jgi:TPR repeat protein